MNYSPTFIGTDARLIAYSKPQPVIRTNAVAKIQQTGTVEGAKAPGQYLDHAIPPTSCTVSAYDADE